MDYKKTFTFQDSSFVEEQVHGKPIRFYPTRGAYTNELTKISRPMVIALTTLFVENGREESATTETMEDAEGTKIQKITVSAVTPELAAQKSKERREALEDLFGALEESNNRLLLGRLLMDSMRDEFPYQKTRTPKDVLEFLDGDGQGYEGIDVPTLALLIGGFIKANAKSFGGVGEQLVGAVKTKLSVLRETSPSETPGTAPTSGGSNSKTATSSQPREASQSSS